MKIIRNCVLNDSVVGVSDLHFLWQALCVLSSNNCFSLLYNKFSCPKIALSVRIMPFVLFNFTKKDFNITLRIGSTISKVAGSNGVLQSICLVKVHHRVDRLGGRR